MGVIKTQDWEGLGLICTCSSQTSRLLEKQAAEVKDPGAYRLRGDLDSTCLTHWLRQDLCYTPGLRRTPLKINPWWQKQGLWHTAQSLGVLPYSPASQLPLHPAGSTFRLKRARQSIPTNRFLPLRQSPRRKDCSLGSHFPGEGRRARTGQPRPLSVSTGKGTGLGLGLQSFNSTCFTYYTELPIQHPMHAKSHT